MGACSAGRLRINVDHANGRDDVEWTIVGVVGNIRSTLTDPCVRPSSSRRPSVPATPLTFFVRSQQGFDIARDRASRASCDRERRSLRWKSARSGMSSAAPSRSRARSRSSSACSHSVALALAGGRRLRRDGVLGRASGPRKSAFAWRLARRPPRCFVSCSAMRSVLGPLRRRRSRADGRGDAYPADGAVARTASNRSTGMDVRGHGTDPPLRRRRRVLSGLHAAGMNMAPVDAAPNELRKRAVGCRARPVSRAGPSLEKPERST